MTPRTIREVPRTFPDIREHSDFQAIPTGRYLLPLAMTRGNSRGLSPIPNRHPRMSRRTAEMGRDVPRLILNQIPFNLDSRIGVSPHSALGRRRNEAAGVIATTSRRRPLLGARRRLAHSSHREDSYEVQHPP